MFKGMDLSDVQVLSPSRGHYHKNYFSRENYFRPNYRVNKGRTFIDMEVIDYPEFGTYFCPFENKDSDNRRYFIKFSDYSKDYPPPHHSVKLSYELKNGNEIPINKSTYFLIYIFFNEKKEWLRFNIDLDSIAQISLGENNMEENKNFSNGKKEQTIYFYLKYSPKIGHKSVNENDNGSNENDYDNNSFDDDGSKKSFKNENSEEKNESFNSSNNLDSLKIKLNSPSDKEIESSKSISEFNVKINDNQNNNEKEKEENDVNCDLNLQNNLKSHEISKRIRLFEKNEKEENEKDYLMNNIPYFEIEKCKSDNCISQKLKLNKEESQKEKNMNNVIDTDNNIQNNKNQINGEKEFYFNLFKTILQKYEYKNHNHHENGEDKKNNSEIKENEKKDKLFIPRNEIKHYDENGFARLDSFLSKENEYLNFYLLNLVMKIKVRFFSIDDFSDLFYDKLKLKEKIVSNTNFIIYEPDLPILNKTQELLVFYSETFYKNLVNLHFSLQYSIFAFITTRKLNLFNNDFFNRIMKAFSKLTCEQQEIMSKALDQITTEAQMNKDLRTLIGARYIELKEQNNLNSPKAESNIISSNNSNNNSSSKKKNTDNGEVKDNISYMRSVEITPSIIYYEVPKLERNNQIIRKFKNYQEHFIKISINDDDHNKIYYASSRNFKLLEIVQSLMMNGIYIGTHKFNYLTSSNSQAKQGSGWYFNLEHTKFEKIDQVLEEMGDFKNEHNKYKNASRRGQCASSTTPIDFLEKENIIEIPDIKSSNGKYIYTDGIGTISFDLALKCVDKVGNNKFSYCSAFQIRLKGIKGVVAVDPKLKDKDIICIRPSMKKYESENNELGIIKASGYSTGYLNRQIIALLSGLGVKNSIFISMIKVSLKEYQTILKYIRNKNLDLCSYFRANKDVYNEVLSKCFYFKALLDYYLYKKPPRGLINEPFIQKILLNCLSLKIRELKSKGKIIDKQSASLMGVIDETGTLKHNEVFVRIVKPFSRKEEQDFILEGEVYVTKNPCLHPGDIKILKAVNNEKVRSNLNHMINVVVFSSLEDENDKRPVQNQISGGDLDGDIYYVSWNKDIIDGIVKRNVPPQEDPKYPSNNPINKCDDNNSGVMNGNNNNIILENTISMNDVILSHINTMKNDLVPLISNLYLAHADNDLVNGPFNDKCRMLSDLFMIAIDSKKNGKFINQDILREKNLLLQTYPDFLETDSYNSYKSPGILGILYRLCNEKEFLDEFDYYEYQNSYVMSYYLDIELFDYKCLSYTHDMLKLYIRYESELKALMQKYNFSDEVSFFLNVDIRNTKNNKKIRDVPPFKEIEVLQKNYKNRIIETFGNYITKPIACACYLVTYMNLHMEKGNPKLFKENKEGRKFVEEWKEYYLYRVMGKSYDSFEAYKDRTKGFEISMLKYKKIFSFPWIIKEIREVLFSIGGFYNDKNGYYMDKEEKKNFSNGYNKKYKGNNYRYNYMNK